MKKKLSKKQLEVKIQRLYRLMEERPCHRKFKEKLELELENTQIEHITRVYSLNLILKNKRVFSKDIAKNFVEFI
jgi:hypothetical protein